MDSRQKSDHSPTFLRHYTYVPPPPKSTGRRRVTRVLLWSTTLIGLPLGLLAMSWLIMLPDTDLLARTNPPSTALMDARQAQAKNQSRAIGRQWMWVPLSYLSSSPCGRGAEDASFSLTKDSTGKELKRQPNASRSRRTKRGGSTITPLWPKTSICHPKLLFLKAREALITRSLEQHLTKKRILGCTSTSPVGQVMALKLRPVTLRKLLISQPTKPPGWRLFCRRRVDMIPGEKPLSSLDATNVF